MSKKILNTTFFLLFLLVLSLNYVLGEDTEINSSGEISAMHKVDETTAPVHQWVSLQAEKIWSTLELQNNINKNSYNDFLDSDGYSLNEGILIGAGEEDKEDCECLGYYKCSYHEHFWDPDISQDGDYNLGVYSPSYSSCISGAPNPLTESWEIRGSAYNRAQYLWDNYVIPNYPSNKDKSYYYLGRVSHLLVDMTVPAHVHNDLHALVYGGDESFEDTMANLNNNKNYWGESESNYEHFVGGNYENEFYQYENLPYWNSEVKSNPSNLFKLFWFTAQKTQHYASDDENGNNILSSQSGTLYCFGPSCSNYDYLWESDSEYSSSLMINSQNDLKDDDNGDWGNDLKKISEANIPHSMKAVSGLYRLFWIETHSLVGCTSGNCCDTNLKITFDKNKEPKILSDGYIVSGIKGPNETNYVKYRNYSCTGSSSTEAYIDKIVDTCGICKYANNGDSSCSNYNSSTIYSSNTQCSSGSGDNNYGIGGEYSCQAYCDGNGNADYAGNCTFSASCASQYTLKPAVDISWHQKGSILLDNKSTVNLSLNKIANEIIIYLDNNLSNSCSQCNTLFSVFTNLAEGEHFINFSLKDYANNTLDNWTNFFTDTKAPIIHNQWPANITRVAPLFANFTVSYTEENIKHVGLSFLFHNENSSFNYPEGILAANNQANITLDNFPEYAKELPIVKELPKDSEVSLKFYNFDSGERHWDRNYTITKGNIEKRESVNPDIEIILHSKYAPEILDFCSTAKKAKQSNDIAFWTNLNLAHFLWRYKGMMEYKDCFLQEGEDYWETVYSPCESGVDKNCSFEVNLSGKEGYNITYWFTIEDIANKITIGPTSSLEIYDCTPNWTLEENWSECQDGDLRFKDWIDSNNCIGNYEKPIEKEMSYYSCDFDDNGLIGNSLVDGFELFINNSSNMSERFIGTKPIKLNLNNKTILEFNFTFTYTLNSSNLSLSSTNEAPNAIPTSPGAGGGWAYGGKNKLNLQMLNITLNSNESDKSYMIVQGIDLTSQNNTKTAYLARVLNGTGICIKDQEITLISEVSETCTGENETWISCPGTSSSYACKLIENGTRYKISGLSHSGIKEQLTYCGDAVCNGGETCSTCSKDCGVCPAPKGGDGGGGGGGGGYISASLKKNITENKTKITEILEEPGENITSTEENVTENNEPIENIKEPGFNRFTGAFTRLFGGIRNNSIYIFYSILGIAVILLGIKLVPEYVRKIKARKIST
ncbi:hypothetical protein A3K73_09305 [Candidatus Pacearchaeota archaeon RBG_13_36_9]|nr:MAG: hypothetical protein A3K73_09305 [Candidatus Pacearchaeota archaeon RBG_13_36_9]